MEYITILRPNYGERGWEIRSTYINVVIDVLGRFRDIRYNIPNKSWLQTNSSSYALSFAFFMDKTTNDPNETYLKSLFNNISYISLPQLISPPSNIIVNLIESGSDTRDFFL